jgi:antitoxin HicB
MNKLAYPAIFMPDIEDGGFVITFPDIPEAITQADSVEEGLEIATDCLDEALCGRLRLGKPLPEPSTLEKGQYLIDVPVQTAIKVLLNNTLKEDNVSKVELARRIDCDEKEVRRLLDPKHASRLSKLEMAFKALGCKLIIEKHSLAEARGYENKQTS